MSLSVRITKAPYFAPTQPDTLLIDTEITLPDGTFVPYTMSVDGWKGMTVDEVGQNLLDTYQRLASAYALIDAFVVLNGQSIST